MIKEFLIIIQDKNGNISPQKFNQKYFINTQQIELWNWFISESINFPNYTQREIITLLKHNYKSPPKCIVCGNNSKIQMYSRKQNFTFDYCSKSCSLKSKTRSIKISITKNSYTTEQKEQINHKREQTNLSNTGYSYNSQRPEIKQLLKQKLSKAQLHTLAYEKLNDKNWLDNQYNTNKRSAISIADEIKADYTTVLDYCRSYGFQIRKYSVDSLPQKQIYDFIKEIYSGNVIYNDWSILNTLELDILIPELNLAIEYNGLLHHSSNNTLIKNKHLNKTILCQYKGIQLIHIRGDQWIFQKNIVKSMIKSKLGLLSNKIYARKCSIIELNPNQSKEFINKNHIQGNVNSSIKYGLIHNDELVSVMTFNKARFNSGYDWELIRFCNKLDHNVIGAFSKLLKHFRKNNLGTIISYCDRSRSLGNVYIKNGFEYIEKKLNPGYCWTDKHKVFNRQQFQKHKLKQLFDEGKLKYYNECESELENMFSNGYRIYYDCGQLIFVLR